MYVLILSFFFIFSCLDFSHSLLLCVDFFIFHKIENFSHHDTHHPTAPSHPTQLLSPPPSSSLPRTLVLLSLSSGPRCSASWSAGPPPGLHHGRFRQEVQLRRHRWHAWLVLLVTTHFALFSFFLPSFPSIVADPCLSASWSVWPRSSSSFRQWYGCCWYSGYDAFALCSLRRRQARGVSTGAVRGHDYGHACRGSTTGRGSDSAYCLEVPQLQLFVKDVDFPVVAQRLFSWSRL